MRFFKLFPTPQITAFHSGFRSLRNLERRRSQRLDFFIHLIGASHMMFSFGWEIEQQRPFQLSRVAEWIDGFILTLIIYVMNRVFTIYPKLPRQNRRTFSSFLLMWYAISTFESPDVMFERCRTLAACELFHLDPTFWAFILISLEACFFHTVFRLKSFNRCLGGGHRTSNVAWPTYGITTLISYHGLLFRGG